MGMLLDHLHRRQLPLSKSARPLPGIKSIAEDDFFGPSENPKQDKQQYVFQGHFLN
jgi:hypothetical protein